jgi:acyl-CoA synthetase
MAMRHVNVMKAAAFPIADARLGEKVCLAVIAKQATAHSPEQLLQHLAKEGLSKYDMPEYYIEVESFPVTASGKVLKRVLVDMARSGELRPLPVRWSDAASAPS